MTAVKPPRHRYDKFGLQADETASGRTDRAQTSDAHAHEGWVPVRDLHARHRDRILDHLMQLDDRDRYLRFGSATSHAGLARYVASLDFRRDEVFGVFNGELQLVAMAHLAAMPPNGRPGHISGSHIKAMEFGVSVLPMARGHGLGGRLFAHAITHARNRHASHLMIHALTENAPMLHIAAKAGATTERDGPDAEAWLKLPPDTVATHIDSSMQSLAAEVVYRTKYHMLHVGNWLRALVTPG
jgi:GNAT superfamily N-acetyltransferase